VTKNKYLLLKIKMTSLGTSANCKKFRCDSIDCTGSITANHKVFGEDELNRGQAHQHGSMLHFKYHQYHATSGIKTTNGVAKATFVTTGNHDLEVGDTIEIGSFPSNLVTEVNGIPASELVTPLSHVVDTVDTTTEFTILSTTLATSTGTDTSALPLVRINRFIYSDMALATSTAVVWSRSTTKPAATHTNTAMWYIGG
jgi:hypothetical protein